MSEARKYFDERIFGPGGLLEAETPEREMASFYVYRLRMTAIDKFVWHHPLYGDNECHPDDAANACRCAAIMWLLTHGEVEIGPIVGGGYWVAPHDHATGSGDTLDVALIAALIAAKGIQQ